MKVTREVVEFIILLCACEYDLLDGRFYDERRLAGVLSREREGQCFVFWNLKPKLSGRPWCRKLSRIEANSILQHNTVPHSPMNKLKTADWKKLPVSLTELCINTTLRCGQSFR